MSGAETSCEVSLDFVLEIARGAAEILSKGAGRRHAGDTKRTTYDLVTEYDRRAEAFLLDEIRRAYPTHFILAEESGERGERGRYRWIVDPLDGTTNFAHGLPIFCVSIALEYDGLIERAVVAAPALGWTFSAARGQGAHLNGERLHVSDAKTLDTALLATGFPYDRATHPQNNFAEFVTVKRRAQGVRRLGSAALDLALVAAGRLDGYWEMRLQPWDIAAGSLLVTEAGGRATTLSGAPFSPDAREVLATNGHVHDLLRETLLTAVLR